jgi:hypothetical protein
MKTARLTNETAAPQTVKTSILVGHFVNGVGLVLDLGSCVRIDRREQHGLGQPFPRLALRLCRTGGAVRVHKMPDQ